MRLGKDCLMAKIIIELDTTNVRDNYIALVLGKFLTAGSGNKKAETPVDSPKVSESPAGGGRESETTTEKLTTRKRGAQRLNGRWSKKFERCQGCGTTEKRHMGGGYCTSCYFKKPEKTQSASEEKPAGREIVKPTSQKLKRSVCQNSNCPYVPSDYRPQDMVTGKSGQKYCCDECRAEVGDI